MVENENVVFIGFSFVEKTEQKTIKTINIKFLQYQLTKLYKIYM